MDDGYGDGPYPGCMYPERRRRSTLAVADNALLVVGAIVAAFVLLSMFGWIVSTIGFLVKFALLAFVVAVAFRFATRRRN